MARPTPPELHVVVSEADEIARQLAALGVTTSPSVDDRVFESLVVLWKENGKSPILRDIAARAGVAAPRTVCDALYRLLDAGRVYHASRGTWIPKVV